LKRNNHPARNARITAGWISTAGLIITGIAVVDDATVQIDLSEFFTYQSFSVEKKDLSLNGSAEPVNQTNSIEPPNTTNSNSAEETVVTSSIEQLDSLTDLTIIDESEKTDTTSSAS